MSLFLFERHCLSLASARFFEMFGLEVISMVSVRRVNVDDLVSIIKVH